MGAELQHRKRNSLSASRETGEGLTPASPPRFRPREPSGPPQASTGAERKSAILAGGHAFSRSSFTSHQ